METAKHFIGFFLLYILVLQLSIEVPENPKLTSKDELYILLI